MDIKSKFIYFTKPKDACDIISNAFDQRSSNLLKIINTVFIIGLIIILTFGVECYLMYLKSFIHW